MYRIYQADIKQCPLLELYNGISDSWLLRWQGLGEGEVVETIVSPRPTLEVIKHYILDWHNKEIDKVILFGHKWRGMGVWLSSENQQNYKASYDLVQQFNGQMGTLPTTFKFGSVEEPKYFTFEDMQTLTEFYLASVMHVKETVVKGWAIKDSLDWSIYEEALSKV